MNQIKEVWFPTEKYLESIREKIDHVLDNYDLGNYPYYEGSGRIVVIIDKVAVKIPQCNEDDLLDGYSQNKKEFRIYSETKHPLLNPIYENYRGCLICKEIMGDMYVLENDYNFSIGDIRTAITKKIEELSSVIEKYDLQDIYAPRNWGYDFLKGEFVCLDYGI